MAKLNVTKVQKVFSKVKYTKKGSYIVLRFVCISDNLRSLFWLGTSQKWITFLKFINLCSTEIQKQKAEDNFKIWRFTSPNWLIQNSKLWSSWIYICKEGLITIGDIFCNSHYLRPINKIEAIKKEWRKNSFTVFNKSTASTLISGDSNIESVIYESNIGRLDS